MIKEKIPELEKLTDPEKLQLINELWDSLTSGKDFLPTPKAHKRILDQRWREHKASPEEGSTWQEVKSSILVNKAQ